MGDVIITTAAGRRVRRAGTRSFTKTKRERFLDALALTCNLTRAAEYAEVTPPTIYSTKRVDPVFAQAFKDALALGYDRLEALVLEHGGAGAAIEFDPDRADAGGADTAPFDVERALKILTFHRGARDSTAAKRTGRSPRNATREETNEALMKQLAAAKRRIDAARDRDG